MQGFINKKYYVDCRTHEEIEQFMEMCAEAGLKFRDGRTPTAEKYGAHAVFAYNWRHDKDNISSWGYVPGRSDGKRPHVLFSDFLDKTPGHNASDILDLL